MDFLAQTDSLFFEKTQLSLDVTQKLVNDILRGADDGELYLEYMRSEVLVWDDGKLKTANDDTSTGFGLRLVCGDSVGFAHAGLLDDDALRQASASLMAVKSGYQGVLSAPPARAGKALYDGANPLLGQRFEERAQLLQKIDSYIRAKDPRVIQVSLSMAANWKAVQILKADNWRAADIRPLTRLHVSAVVAQGDRMEVGSHGGGGRCGYESVFDPSVWQDYADEALRQALVNLDSVDGQAGEMTVVLGSGWPAVLLHEAIGHGLEGDFNRKQTSVFSSLMGQQIAAKGITIVDDGTIMGRRGSLTIDDEGTPTQCTKLVEDGVLVGLMQDRMNARLMGTVSTGNGRRESFAHQPYPRMTNTMMLSGAYDPKEIIASVDKGLYAVGLGGGQVDITSGKFVFSTSEAYEIEKGQIKRPVKDASLVGTGFEILKSISMVGNDGRLDPGMGTCGKNGQSVPVGVGQPTLRLDNITVGGAKV
ncbi:MAG: metalloprotease TldD [Alphaproteobacteria bacterium]|nr:metalloprotease TldD [Alphaproteobacteria bacterium]